MSVFDATLSQDSYISGSTRLIDRHDLNARSVHLPLQSSISSLTLSDNLKCDLDVQVCLSFPSSFCKKIDSSR